jgi:hypothetical protein
MESLPDMTESEIMQFLPDIKEFLPVRDNRRNALFDKAPLVPDLLCQGVSRSAHA